MGQTRQKGLQNNSGPMLSLACVYCYSLRSERNGYQRDKKRKELQRWVVNSVVTAVKTDNQELWREKIDYQIIRQLIFIATNAVGFK